VLDSRGFSVSFDGSEHFLEPLLGYRYKLPDYGTYEIAFLLDDNSMRRA